MQTTPLETTTVAELEKRVTTLEAMVKEHQKALEAILKEYRRIQRGGSIR